MERRLAAIFAADMVGFSRLMEADEMGTLTRQKRHRAELIDPRIDQHGGKIIKLTGDGMIAEFPSVVEAVQCAVSLQQEMEAREADIPEDQKIRYRVAVNLGDVIFDDEENDVYGDGVNIAARLEALAEPGGVVVSGTAYDHLKSNIDVGYVDLGEQQVKNIATPVRVYKVVPGGSAAPVWRATKRRRPWALAAAAAGVLALLAVAGYRYAIWSDIEPADPTKMAFALDDRPSIAVLAFDNLTGDPNQEHVSDGLSEDIISALARLPGLLVVARNSSFTYKGKAVDIRQIAEEMSVRYVLEGSLQQSDESLRVTAQLIDAVSGHHVWSQKFDRPRADIFKVRDEITERIVQELNIEIVAGSSFFTRANLYKSVDAWLIGQKAAWHGYQWNPADNKIAIELAHEILAIEPESEAAYEHLAWRHANDAVFSWVDDPAESWRQAAVFAEKVVAQDDQYSGGYLALAFTRLFGENRNAEAIELGERALELAPSDPLAMAILALIYQKDMQAERAIELFQRAVRVDRRAPGWVWEDYGEALLMAGRYKDAVPIYIEALKSTKGHLAGQSHLGLAIAYDTLGQEAKARSEIEAAIEAAPYFTVSYLRGFQRYKDQAYKDRWLTTLKRLGLPDE